ncbi:MAG: hypothetical protein ACLPY3_27025 [Solirubrobacteraceae bacterium]
MKIISAGAFVASAALLLNACGSSSPTTTTNTTGSFQSAVTQAFITMVRSIARCQLAANGSPKIK